MMKAVLIGFVGLVVLPAAVGISGQQYMSGKNAVSDVHNFHVSYGQMAVEDSFSVCRIRFFGHDLEKALQEHAHNPELTLAVNLLVDSLFSQYYNQNLVLEYRGIPLEGFINSSSEDGEMWWYAMTYHAPDIIDAFKLRNTLLFDVFPDQKNIFKIKHFPSEVSQSLYFAPGTAEYDITF